MPEPDESGEVPLESPRAPVAGPGTPMPSNPAATSAAGWLRRRQRPVCCGRCRAALSRGKKDDGTLAGTAIDTEDTLAFGVLENVRPMIETFLSNRLLMLTLA
jgi:hypothetical protein